MIRIAILASGSGTNAENIIKYFSGHSWISVNLIISNKKDAYVLERAKNHEIPSLVFPKKEFDKAENVINALMDHQIDYIILAGFLLKIHPDIIDAFRNKIYNIHPALLPNYGGKGMYGMHVHEAVVRDKQEKSGITIHHVNENYDEGNIIFQAECTLDENETAESLAKKIHQLEYEHFPKVIEKQIFPGT